MRILVAALVRCYALSLALICLSGASPRVCEVSWEPDAGALAAVAGCPSGSCEKGRG